MENQDTNQKCQKFNGHRNWNYWNVSLWINNDENLYIYALGLIDDYGVDDAAIILTHEFSGATTPDGAAFSKGAVRAALLALDE